MSVVLPVVINKFMHFRHDIEKSQFKQVWKHVKPTAVLTKYRNINAKFLRSHAELNKYFDNSLIDVTPQLNPKQKRKYGVAFLLPDHKEYCLKLSLDSSRIKVYVSSGTDQTHYEEWVAQYLSFLLSA